MAVPKRKMSRSRTRSRRSQWTAQVPELVPATTADGRQVKVPARLVRAVRRGLVVPD